jgi:hypothetical protein
VRSRQGAATTHQCALVTPYAEAVSEQKQPAVSVRPLDPPMVPFAVGGIAIWAVLGLLALAFRDTLAAHGHTDWLWICVAGVAWGILGLFTMLRHDANRRRRRAALPGA